MSDQTTACGWGAACCGRDPRGCIQPAEGERQTIEWLRVNRVSTVWLQSPGRVIEQMHDRRGLPVFRVPARSVPA